MADSETIDALRDCQYQNLSLFLLSPTHLAGLSFLGARKWLILFISKHQNEGKLMEINVLLCSQDYNGGTWEKEMED